MTAAVTIQLNDETLSALDSLAVQLDRTRTSLVHEALAEWIAFQQAQIAEIEAGIADADAGRFVSDEDIARIVSGRDS